MLHTLVASTSRRIAGAFSNTISRPFQLSNRSYIVPAQQRQYQPAYDKEIVKKYPRVLECIQEKIPRESLTKTERAAYYVATYGNGTSGGRRVRAATRQADFVARVNARVAEWERAEFQRRKEVLRQRLVRNKLVQDVQLQKVDKAPRLSTYKDTVNKGPKPVEFKLTKSLEEEVAAAKNTSAAV